MSFLNYDILNQNTLALMKNNNITQEKLATILGMSQPNVSKALSQKDKKCFTLDQVAGIANYFGVSIDYLVGNTGEKAREIGPRAVAEFLSKVIESHDAKFMEVEIEETVFEDSYGGFGENSFIPRDRKETYPAIYFPSYWDIPSEAEVGPVIPDELFNDASANGNETRMLSVNDFLRKFIQIFEVYDKNGIDEEAYRIVVDNFLSKLDEK